MGIFDFLKKKKTKKPTPKPKKEEVKVVEPIKKAPVKKKDLREVYKILKEPHISEKATQLSDQGKYTFKIYSDINKIQVKQAIENLYGVKVKDINMINIKPKKRVLRGFEGRKVGYKKAIITLEEGYKIELLPH